MKNIGLNRVGLPKVGLREVALPLIGGGGKSLKPELPEWFKEAIVSWHSPIWQGCTNEEMAKNPILRDLSGNGWDATCYNFAWTKECGIDDEGAIVVDGVDSYILQPKPVFYPGDFTYMAVGYLSDKAQSHVGASVAWNTAENGYKNQDTLFFELQSRAFSYRKISSIYGINIYNIPTPTLRYFWVAYIKGKRYDEDYNITSILVGNFTDTDMWRLNSGDSLCAKYKHWLWFNRALTIDEMKWVRENLMPY